MRDAHAARICDALRHNVTRICQCYKRYTVVSLPHANLPRTNAGHRPMHHCSAALMWCMVSRPTVVHGPAPRPGEGGNISLPIPRGMDCGM